MQDLFRDPNALMHVNSCILFFYNAEILYIDITLY